MKKILFLGYVVSPEEANRASGASVAGNKMQWNIVRHLSREEDVTVRCMTITPLACFPHDKTVFKRAEETELCKGVISQRIRYVNLPIVKQVSQIISMYRAAKKAILEEQINQMVCFNLFPQVGVPVRWLKRRFPQIPAACILADLPIDDNTKRKGLSVWLRKVFEKQTWKSFPACDQFVVLNKKVAELYLDEKPYIVVDGGIDENEIPPYEAGQKQKKEKNVLFCGALTEYNGILNLIRAFDRIRADDIYLDIYGDGYLRNEVEDAAKRNAHIRFHGRVDNSVVMEKQREAWLLMNPRNPDDFIAQVTFPSKTFEYLLSGTPVLSTRLNGYTEEYDGVMIYTGYSCEEMAEKIQSIAKMDAGALNDMAENARKFVCERRTWRTQAGRIADFLRRSTCWKTSGAGKV